MEELVTELATARLLLRPMQQQDLALFTRLSCDPEVIQFIREAPDAEALAEMFKTRCEPWFGAEGQWLCLTVIVTETQQAIGSVGLKLSCEKSRIAEVGYTFLPESQGKGYAREAVRRVFDFAFNSLQLHRVSALCDVDNHSSYKLMEAMGMQREARLRDNYFRFGQHRDEYVYGILRCEWPAHAAG